MSESASWNIHTILVPIDRSEGASRSLTVAVNIAQCNGLNTIRLMHAVDPDIFGAVSADLDHYMLEPIIAAGRGLLDKAGEHVRATGLDAITEIVEDAPVDAILNTVERVDADLVVIATRGRTGLRRILGSVGLATIVYAPCSVLAVPDIRDNWTIQRILLPLDHFDEASIAAVAEISRKRGGELTVLGSDDDIVAKAKAALDQPDIRAHVVRMDAKDMVGNIVDVANQFEADLVVLAPDRTTPRNVKLDHRAQILLHELHCPLLIVRPRG